MPVNKKVSTRSGKLAGAKAFSEETVAADPLVQFLSWFSEAARSVKTEVNAMCLSTVGANGRPSSRMVLLKAMDGRGFVFFTCYDSRKGREISENPSVAANFFWKEMERQVRITGKVKKLSREESREYFASRPSESRISAAISPQSQVIPDRAWLERRKTELLKSLDQPENIPLPSNWGGYRIFPDEVEFWQGGEHRLHDRILYKRKGQDWTISRLAP
jgi:pyridoxamine 5'-phosphate oxidase